MQISPMLRSSAYTYCKVFWVTLVNIIQISRLLRSSVSTRFKVLLGHKGEQNADAPPQFYVFARVFCATAALTDKTVLPFPRI